MALCTALGWWAWSQNRIGTTPVVESGGPVREREEQVVPRVDAASADRSEVDAAPSEDAAGLVKVAELQGAHEKNLQRLNRVLREAGRPEVAGDQRVAIADLEVLNDMIEACNKSINDAAAEVLEFQDPFASKMAAEVRAAVDAGETVPYQVLERGLIPKRGPYDLLVTSAYKGVVYAGFLPQNADLFEVVDKQRLAEQMRLASYQDWAAKAR